MPDTERPALYSVALHFHPGELKVVEAKHNLTAQQARAFIEQHRLREHIQVVKTQRVYIGPAYSFDLDDLR